MIDSILEARLDTLENKLKFVGEPDKFLIKLNQDKLKYLVDGYGPWPTIKLVIAKRVNHHKTQIVNIRDKLAQAKHLGHPVRGQRIAEAWDDYRVVDKGCQEILKECLEILNGLAFREIALDDNICEVADELIESWSTNIGRWPSLTVPAYKETLSRTLARIVRIRFPEWTVWTLPLIAHEYGHIVVTDADLDLGEGRSRIQVFAEENSVRLKELDPCYRRTFADPTATVEQKRAAEELAERHAAYRLQEYLADGFATYVMGPAFACAALLIRLDPAASARPSRSFDLIEVERAHAMLCMLHQFEPFSHNPSPLAPERIDLERAHVILCMLRKMDEDAGPFSSYDWIIKILSDAWTRTLLSFKDAGKPFEPPAPEIFAVIDSIVGEMRELFDDEFVKIPLFPANVPNSGWLLAQNWAKTWLDAVSPGDLEALPVPPICLMRDVLNAAWACRIKRPEFVEGLTLRAREMCKVISVRRRGGGGGTGMNGPGR
jgi:hypothetical protein